MQYKTEKSLDYFVCFLKKYLLVYKVLFQDRAVMLNHCFHLPSTCYTSINENVLLGYNFRVVY